MELVKELESRRDKKGRLRKWGLFLCSFDNKLIECQLFNGFRNVSCGCQHYYLISKSNKGHIVTEETRVKIGLANKGNCPTEEARQKMSKAKKGQRNSKEHNKNISKSKKGIKLSEKHIQKLKESHIGKTGELASNWQGGISFESYGLEFNKELKEYILERDSYTCQDPNCLHLYERLEIHHIDCDKKNNNPENLISLCISCHGKTKGKNSRNNFIIFYKNIIKIKYAY